MIYTLKNTIEKDRPIAVYLDGEEVTYAFYLDPRRRVIRRFKTNDASLLFVDPVTGGVAKEELRYSHRRRLTVEQKLSTGRNR